LKLILFALYAIALSAALARRGLRGRQRLTAAPGDGVSGKRFTRLLIVGATGGTGRQLVAEALERGHVVTALVRDASKLEMQHERLRVVQGDVLDYPSIDAAVREQDAVICALGHKRFFYPTRILSEGTGNLLRAMHKHGVGRLVCETSLGIGDSAGRMGVYYTLFVIPVILPFYFWDKTRQELLVAASTLEWVIVRPGVLTNSAKRGTYRHGFDVGSLIRTVRISRGDVAGFMLDQLTDDTYLGMAPGVSW
jgi:putative NADH-flavin reductase